jgi:hypothetical protein
LLGELKQAHREMLDALSDLAMLTSEAVPDEPAITSIRYKLSRVGSRRRALVDDVCAALLPQVAAVDAARLKGLCDANVVLFKAMVDHVTTWSLRELVKDWPGYCAASNALQPPLLERVAEEQAVLYPLLEATP